MKKFCTTFLVGIASIALIFPWNSALAYDPYNPYYYPTNYPVYPNTQYNSGEQAALIQQIILLIQQLQMQLNNQQGYLGTGTYYPPIYGGNYTFYPTVGTTNTTSSDRPDVRTSSPSNIDRSSAELRGDIDMRDSRGGEVFFVYGESERLVKDIANRYDEYYDVRRDERRGDFMTLRVDSNPRSREYYSERITGLDSDRRYYFTLCVEYDDYDRNTKLECSNIDDFRTTY